MANNTLVRQRKHAQIVLTDTERERLLLTEIGFPPDGSVPDRATVEAAVAALDWIAQNTDETTPTFILHLAARIDGRLAKEFGLALSKHYFAAAMTTADAALKAAARGRADQIEASPFTLVVTCRVVDTSRAVHAGGTPLTKAERERTHFVKVVAVSAQYKATGEAQGHYTPEQAERIMATLKAIPGAVISDGTTPGSPSVALLAADHAGGAVGTQMLEAQP